MPIIYFMNNFITVRVPTYTIQIPRLSLYRLEKKPLRPLTVNEYKK
jgi:hypothetical protein